MCLSKEYSKEIRNPLDINLYGVKYIDIKDLTSSYYYEKNTNLNKPFNKILLVTLETNDKNNLIKAIDILKETKKFEYVGPNYNFNFFSLGSNSLSPKNNIISDNSIPYELVNVPEAKQFISNYSKTNINIGVLDFGVDASHNDFYGKISNLSRSFVKNASALVDGYGNSAHGTAIAGIIVANNLTVNKMSINDNSSIVSLRHNLSLELNEELGDTIDIYDTTVINTESVVRAFNYATEQGIRILNFSSGFYNNDEAIKFAIQNYSGLVVCGAGNSGFNVDNSPVYPASYGLSNVIVVGGMDNNYQLCCEPMNAYSSNYGLTTVDLFAPGSNIFTNTINNEYDYFSGTSFSAPFVAGVASLILSIEDYCNSKTQYNIPFYGEDLKYIISNSVTLSNYLENYCISGGYLNALTSIQLALNYNPIVTYDYYNYQYHKIVTRRFEYFEEHNWIVDAPSLDASTYAVTLRYKCSKCNTYKMY